MGQLTHEDGPVSDYTREQVFYRSLQHPEGVLRDRLNIHDYVWRWDTDWFWCSRAFGAQDPTVRRLWPRHLRRSSVYWKIIGWDRRWSIADRIEAHHGRPARERVVQDIEVTVDRLPEFLSWFFDACEIEPVWLCPLQLRDGAEPLTRRAGEVLRSQAAVEDGAADNPWPLYPLRPHTVWVNVGFWSSVPVDLLGSDQPAGAFNRAIEAKVEELGGHKSLYSESFYSAAEFAAHYGGRIPDLLKDVYDPTGRFPSLYEKTVGFNGGSR